MTVTQNNGDGSIVAQPGQQIYVASLLDLTATIDPTYLVVSLLDRDEYTASSNGETGRLSGNGHTIGFSNIGGDSDTVGIVFTYNAATGQYTNSTYGNLANLVYTASTNTDDNTSISFFTTNNASLANTYANNPYALEFYAPTNTSYVGSISVVTQPAFAGTTPSQATPNSIEGAAMSFVGKAWNLDGCWVLASNISAIAGASLPITSPSLGIPGVANGEWIVAYNGPAGQTGNWEANITAGEMVVFETSATSGHITTVVSGTGSSAMLVDNITYVNQNGQIVNSANDGSASDIIIAAPHLASQEWASAVTGSVVVYELDCPVITIATAVSTDAAGKTAALAPLFSASNPLASQAITKYQFYDVGTGGAASDSFVVGGSDEVGHSAPSAITVNTSALSTADLLAGSSSGTDTIEVRAFNGSYWGDWVSMTVNITGNAPSPTVINPTPTGGGPQPSSGVLSALSLDQQTELIYIGNFNRSADAGGFSFWEGQDASAQAGGQHAALALTNIANSFTPQAETIAIYPFLSNPNPNFSSPTVQTRLNTFIENVYGNLFGHTADSGGSTYWTGQIESGAVGLGAAVLAIANGASGSDATILQNKIAVALDFTNLTTAANLSTNATYLAEAKTVLAAVDGVSLNDASVTAAEALIAPWIASQPHAAASMVVVGTGATTAHAELV
jgi:hypothetical protein